MICVLISLLKGKNRDKLALLRSNPTEKELLELCHSSDLKECYRLEKGNNFLRFDEIKKIILEKDIKPISINDLKYPGLLKEIYDPPFLLFVRGDLDTLSSKLVSVVGTRKPSLKGYKEAFKLGLELGRDDIGVVSGLALGIDGAVHRGNLTTRGKTVAVLGSGIDTIYPKSHKELASCLLHYNHCR